MDPREIANRYYDAWISRNGDMSQVPLADDLVFRGPVASFDSAEGYRTMARQAGVAVTSFRVRHQFTDGNLVFSVVDWQDRPRRAHLRRRGAAQGHGPARDRVITASSAPLEGSETVCGNCTQRPPQSADLPACSTNCNHA